jgi:hypothetical protein
MVELPTANLTLRPLFSIGSRAAGAVLRPIADLAGVAVDAGLELQRHAVERVLDSSELERLVVGVFDNPELERLVGAVFDNPRVQAAITKALDSEGAKQLVDSFFASSLFEDVITRLLESKPLWVLVEEIADSPSVTAAVTGQGLGFADQVGGEVRDRSREADDWLERAAHRLRRRRASGPKKIDGDEQGSGETA